MADSDDRYLKIVLDAIRVCVSYKPKLGQSSKVGLDLNDFQRLYRSDPFYSWFGLDNPLMYAAHRAAGGMTSVYRQIGMGCERLIRQLLQDYLGLCPTDTTWSYTTVGVNKKTRKLSLDGRIPLDELKKDEDRQRVKGWIGAECKDLGVDPSIAQSLKGVVFEIRQGYKSKDAKRQNADIANAATAYTQAYLPCLLILSAQIDTDIASRYQQEQWAILIGTVDNNPVTSTYAFMRDVVGYDLAAFFERHKQTLHKTIDAVLNALLSAENQQGG
ncbi:MAG: hypothetical protein KAV82_13375 [Phycisphaerae bacterium]|nr:hypothetical protein [Phycisphaerae bacterium]